MVTGWRRAFCTSIPKEKETTVLTEKQQTSNTTTTTTTTNQSPRFSTKFGFFSNPSTPRLQSQSISSSTLRCKTTTTTTNTTTTPTSSVPNSPKLQCKTTTPKKTITTNSPRFFNFSNPSSPTSPFSLLKSTLRVSKTRCGICLQSAKSGQGSAVFTAECSHSFHFSCISTHIQKHHHHHNHHLLCPVCSTTWEELPLLSLQKHHKPDVKTHNNKSLKVYNDDEPLLMSPISLAHFNPIPESEENSDNENETHEFQGFFVNNKKNQTLFAKPKSKTKTVSHQQLQLTLLSEVAVVSVNRSSETYAVVLKLKAPPSPTAARRVPIDIVTVVDVSGNMSGVKLQLMKRALKLVTTSLSSTDRLSIVAFCSTSKRLLPLRRMTANGRRSARRLIDALGSTGQQGLNSINVSDALKKAVKVLEDRRERNPVASIILLTDGHDEGKRFVTTTRFSHLEIPVHALAFKNIGGACNHSPPPEELLGKLVGGLISVVVQDLRLELGLGSGVEISAVYSLSGRPVCLGSRSVRVGDLYAEEERELLVELKVPNSSIGTHHVMSVQSSLRDQQSQELIYCKEQTLLLPRPNTVRSSSSSSSNNNIQRLRNLHVSTRAVAESRRLIEQNNDLSGAYHLLSSARAVLMMNSNGNSADEFLRGLEAELAELQQRRRQLQRQRVGDEKQEPLTPTSAWKAAERLAKVAIMRKHMNRVSDLHGFENARF